MIDIEALREINHIIEHDATSSTYKYALLKATIDAIQKFDHLIVKNASNTTVSIPLGLIVDAWIIDYMPFVFANIKQQHNGLVFDRRIEEHYHNIFGLLQLKECDNWQYAYKVFLHTYRQSIVDETLAYEFSMLATKIARKIVTMPMKHIGKTYYGIFSPERLSFSHISKKRIDGFVAKTLIESFGLFEISIKYYYIFRYLGHSLYGTSTIQSKWIAKTIQLNKSLHQQSDIELMLGELFDTRDTSDARKIFAQADECVWSGKKLSKKNMDIDHMLPYSIWLNNDLWNLLPADRNINQKDKKEKIPSRAMIQKRSEIIQHYWNIYDQKRRHLFRSQISYSLVGGFSHSDSIMYDDAIEALCKKSDYLILDRGLAPFNI